MTGVLFALGELSTLPEGWETVRMGKEARESSEMALTLNPNHVGAVHGLGVWHRQVATLTGPVQLAKTLLAMGEVEEARSELETILRLPEERPAERAGKTEAAILLERIGGPTDQG